MKNPVATYRVQLHAEYTFAHLQEIIDYLHELGISTVYSSPFFEARAGSSHGYDIVNPFVLNPEIGRLDVFRKITARLKQKDMDWLQDIVPNHMAFDPHNIWLRDIFELGPQSNYYNFFDIDWDDSGKVLCPFLGNPLEEVLAANELQLKLSKKGFSWHYFDQEYAASAKSYAEIFGNDFSKSWQKKFQNFSGAAEEWQQLKEFLLRELEKDAEFEADVQKRVEEINASEEKLKDLLQLQYFLPAHWQETEKHINYRRFFTINDLICLRMEDQAVFDNYHRFILQLCEEGFIQGLRIDHIDGLYNPKEYFERLREQLGPDFYIIIEKILEWDEKLPKNWPVEGTSGYGFLATVNQVLTNGESAAEFQQAYEKINPNPLDFETLIYKQKTFILLHRMGGEYNNLWQLGVDLELFEKGSRQQREALGAFLAAFPVYRIYPEEFPLNSKQKEILTSAFHTALHHQNQLEKELEGLLAIFTGEANKNKEYMLQFLQRCQQFTGPLAAKGVEDTVFYRYNQFISHNEVGDSPENFGLDAKGFHTRMQKRLAVFPLSINATATHDTKRGEDSRMRLNVLSEMPGEWFEKVAHWKQLALPLKKDKAIPDANEEYFIYQMLIAAWPFEGVDGDDFLARSQAYLQKVLREAKVHSSWAAPDEDYEAQVQQFLEQLIASEEFLSSFQPFQQKIGAYGVIKSLSQVLLKITAPGIPDVYQGTELWDFSYVDPDNRRPVNYDLRKQYLQELSQLSSEKIPELKKNFHDGKIKMYCLHKALHLRQEIAEIFEKGYYIPLEIKGAQSKQILAFARKKGEKTVVLAVPLNVSALFSKDLQPNEQLEELTLILPQEAQNSFKNVFTGKIFSEKELSGKALFQDFPVALLVN